MRCEFDFAVRPCKFLMPITAFTASMFVFEAGPDPDSRAKVDVIRRGCCGVQTYTVVHSLGTEPHGLR